MPRNKKDLSGNRYERLTVIDEAGCSNTKNTYWLCICDCGVLKEVRGYSLTSGNTKSCGCFNSDQIAERNTTHGLAYHPLYSTWHSMKDRCLNPNATGYKNYGGRGITTCKRWLNSFPTFLSDMGERPEGLTLERVNNELGYSPENCVWATYKEQRHNRRDSHNIKN